MRLAWISLIIVPFYVAVIRMLSPRIKETSHDLQEVVEEFSGELQERVAGVSTVKSFARETDEARRFHHRTTEMYDLTIREREAVVDPSDVHRVHLARRAADRDLGGRADDHARSNDDRNRGRVLRSSSRALPAAAALLGVVDHRGDLALAAIERIFAFFDETPEVHDVPGARAL